MNTTRFCSFLLPLLAALPIRAADVDFGIQGNLVLPTRTWSDANHLDRRAGYGLGIQAPIDFGSGHVLRPRLDYLRFRRNSGAVTYKADSLLLMADYNYHLAGTREGAYLIGGLGLHHTFRDVARPLGQASVVSTQATTGFAYDLGVGYSFNRNLALEVKYLGLSMGSMSFSRVPKASLFDPAFMANGVQVSFSYTF